MIQVQERQVLGGASVVMIFTRWLAAFVATNTLFMLWCGPQWAQLMTGQETPGPLTELVAVVLAVPAAVIWAMQLPTWIVFDALERVREFGATSTVLITAALSATAYTALTMLMRRTDPRGDRLWTRYRRGV